MIEPTTSSEVGCLDASDDAPRILDGADGARIEIVCSSRELFGADRSALRLADVLRELGATPILVVPRARPERGLRVAAESRGLEYEEGDVAVVGRRGIEGSAGLVRRRRSSRADLAIVNSTAVVSTVRPAARKLVMVREWLLATSLRHRVLVARHRFCADAVVAVSSDALRQWRACSYGPSREYVVPNWLEQSVIDASAARREAPTARDGILFLGRFNQWKGQDVLADAWEAAFADLSERPGLTFVGAQPGTEFAPAGERLAERGRRWGWRVLPFDDSPGRHLGSAALVVVPSLHPEPFGVVLLEALAYGCRVMAFPGGGPTDLAPVFRHALEVVPRAASSLASALSAWWHDGGRAQTADDLALSDRIIAASYSTSAATGRWGRLL